MRTKLTVTAGPHQGKEFAFEGQDSFLVGRSNEAHFQLGDADPLLSRKHFLIQVNPPRCRLIDLNSRCGTFVNGAQVQSKELADGDEIRAGKTIIKFSVIAEIAVQSTGTWIQEGPIAATGDFPSIPGLQITREIGRGGMGIVYKATRRSDGLTVAVKTIQPLKGTGEKHRARFLREIAILRDLDHKYIVRYLDSGETPQLLFLVMEFIDGINADELIRTKGPLNVRRAVLLTCQLLQALEYAHNRGFVHRDIKPANILLAKNGPKRIVKLADFGLARVFESSGMSGLTLQGDFGGTLNFAAPEQITHYRDVKPAADQFSAGATLYFLLTSKYIHDLPRTAADAMAHIVNNEVVPIEERGVAVPDELAAIVHRSLKMEQQERFADVRKMMKALLVLERDG